MRVDQAWHQDVVRAHVMCARCEAIEECRNTVDSDDSAMVDGGRHALGDGRFRVYMQYPLRLDDRVDSLAHLSIAAMSDGQEKCRRSIAVKAHVNRTPDVCLC